MTLNEIPILQKPLTRIEYQQIIQAGIEAGQFTFVRQASLNWLAAYPGDLHMSLAYARALFGENRYHAAVQVLTGLCKIDPEKLESINLLLEVLSVMRNPGFINQTESSRAGYSQEQIANIEGAARAQWFALNGGKQNGEWSASWGGPLWLTKQAIKTGDMNLAVSLMDELLESSPNHPLIGITHLQLLTATSTDQQLLVAAARRYHHQWPDTLYFILRLAEWSLTDGKADYAVALIHQAASRDIEGQVARRMWGEGHPFQALWPDRLELTLSLMIPSVILEKLGWNRLPAGNLLNLAEEVPARNQADELPANQVSEDQFIHIQENDQKNEIELSADQITKAEIAQTSPASTQEAGETPAPHAKVHASRSEIRVIAQEFERFASKEKRSGITLQNGLFQIYVIFSIRSRLRSVYGLDVANLIENEMAQLAEAVRGRIGWGAEVFFADDPAFTGLLGLKPAKPDDPWGIKLTLSDLDESLEKKGERIGALLIVGGPEIVPFHFLPNPMDDPDTDIPSDNPYSTRGKNYFIPDWPVGRLPGGANGDAHLIINKLRAYQAEHNSRHRSLPWFERFKGRFSESWKNIWPAYRHNFGYTAEVWRQAASDVFSSIANPGSMYVSPPCGISNNGGSGNLKAVNEMREIPCPSGKLGYFNLHGVVDAAEWFGHRDLQIVSDKPDYPVALRPQDISANPKHGRVPLVIFSEACFGAHLTNRTVDEAICLKFLEAGCQGYIGSTSMAYGSIAAVDMVAGDLLGYTFYRFLLKGMPVGEALRQSKIFLASEMNRRQGYLDGEDQKTLISFVLYGDPLGEPMQKARVPKTIRYQEKPLANVLTICDRVDAPEFSGPVPAAVMNGVRQAVAKYLPGMSDAKLAYVSEHLPHDQKQPNDSALHNQTNPAGVWPRGKSSGVPFRNLVTLSKQVVKRGGSHPEIARLTLDENGKLLKLVVSR